MSIAADWVVLVAPGLIWGASFLFIALGALGTGAAYVLLTIAAGRLVDSRVSHCISHHRGGAAARWREQQSA